MAHPTNITMTYGVRWEINAPADRNQREPLRAE